MQVAICDDEAEMRKLLAERVGKYCPEAEILLLESGGEVLALCPAPQILLLDIGLPDMDGMEAARAFREKNKDTVLIFITALEEYVFQAFDVGAFHYLVKPFTDEKLAGVLLAAVSQVKKGAVGRHSVCGGL